MCKKNTWSTFKLLHFSPSPDGFQRSKQNLTCNSIRRLLTLKTKRQMNAGSRQVILLNSAFLPLSISESPRASSNHAFFWQSVWLYLWQFHIHTNIFFLRANSGKRSSTLSDIHRDSHKRRLAKEEIKCMPKETWRYIWNAELFSW